MLGTVAFSLSIIGSEAWSWRHGVAICIAVTLIAADTGVGAASCYQSFAVVGREHLEQSSQGQQADSTIE